MLHRACTSLVLILATSTVLPAADGSERRVLAGHGKRVHSFALSPDGGKRLTA